MNRNSGNIANLMPGANDKYEVLNNKASTHDIINAVINDRKNFAIQQTKDIAIHFKGRDLRSTCKNIFDFINSNFKYEVDKEGYQFIQVPSWLIKSKKADCKSYSLFITGILSNLNIPHAVRFIKDQLSEYPNEYTHVYVVAGTPGNYITIDTGNKNPVFNKEYQYINGKPLDYWFCTSTGSISGWGWNNPFDWFKEKLDDTGDWLKKASSNIGNEVEVVWQKIKTVFPLTVAARNSYLLLLSVNMRGWATKLYYAKLSPAQAKAKGLDPTEYVRANKAYEKARLMWYKLGGNRQTYDSNIDKGWNKKPIFGSSSNIGGIGEAATVTAALTTASAIITSMSALLGLMEFTGITDFVKDSNQDTDNAPPPQEGNGENDKTILVAGLGAAALLLMMVIKKGRTNKKK